MILKAVSEQSFHHVISICKETGQADTYHSLSTVAGGTWKELKYVFSLTTSRGSRGVDHQRTGKESNLRARPMTSR
jgi:hypothetical protein